MNINKFDQYLSAFIPEIYDALEPAQNAHPEQNTEEKFASIPCPYLQELKKKRETEMGTSPEERSF